MLDFFFASLRPAAACGLCFLLAACAQPTTLRPQATPAELAAERQAEQQAALANPFPPIVEPVKPTKKMRMRMQNIANRIAPAATRLCREMFAADPKRKCSFALEVYGYYGVNASADGEGVTVTGPMMVFAADDTHLAFVLSHELAHNIMRHQAAMGGNAMMGAVLGSIFDALASAKGANTKGGFSKTGAQIAALSYSPAFEQEADYVGLYILARAGGYRIEKAPEFWRAMSQFDPDGIYARTTHPSNPERFVAMAKTIAEIKSKQARRLPLLPERMAQLRPPPPSGGKNATP